MTKEWLGVITSLALAAVFGACADEVESNGTSSPASSSNSSSTGGQGGTVATGGDGGTVSTGGNGGMGTGGMGCGNVPAPTQPLSCGGTTVASASGGTSCSTSCTDANSDVYSVDCDNLGNCSCKVNGNEMCTCSDPNAACSAPCCPMPWQNLVDTSGAGGFGGAGTSSSVSVSTATATSTGNTTASSSTSSSGTTSGQSSSATGN